MKCPACGHLGTLRTLDSRKKDPLLPDKNIREVRCKQCGETYETEERIVPWNYYKTKRDDYNWVKDPDQADMFDNKG